MPFDLVPLFCSDMCENVYIQRPSLQHLIQNTEELDYHPQSHSAGQFAYTENSQASSAMGSCIQPGSHGRYNHVCGGCFCTEHKQTLFF